MKTVNLYLIMATLSTLAILLACRHELLNPAPGNGTGTGSGNNSSNPATTITCSPDTAYFVNDIMPIISSNCTMSGCHDNISHAEGVNLTTYDRIIRYVSAGNAAGSKLYTVMNKTGNNRMPPPPMNALTAAQKTLVQKWINQGAKNNNCTGSCDTASFTFSAAIKPMMNNKCAGCHNPSSPGGNIDLSAYNAVKGVAQNGKLYGSVAQQPGFSPMPKNGIKLSDCEIRQIQKWISAGSLNN